MTFIAAIGKFRSLLNESWKHSGTFSDRTLRLLFVVLQKLISARHDPKMDKRLGQRSLDSLMVGGLAVGSDRWIPGLIRDRHLEAMLPPTFDDSQPCRPLTGFSSDQASQQLPTRSSPCIHW